MNITIAIIFLVVWYISGVLGYLLTRRYYADVTIMDIVLSFMLGGTFGFFTLYFCVKHWYGYDMFSQIVFKKKEKDVPKVK